MQEEAIIVVQVQTWLQEIVIGLNFCPFAQQPFIQNRIRYVVFNGKNISTITSLLQEECNYLSHNNATETTLIIFPNHLKSFASFLQQVSNSNQFLERKKLIQHYQLAHFHPQYVFANQGPNDAANYTNRSPYPILHIIRQASLTEALKQVKHPHLLPENNIRVAQQKGTAFFEALLLRIKEQNITQ